MTAVLARHVGHSVTIRSPQELRCLDCAHTILIPSGQSTSTSSSPIPGPGDPVCANHGRYAGVCRACAADAKADENRIDNWRPTADVAARAAEARAALTRRHP